MTPSLEALIAEKVEQRLRQMQTAYPAEVISYNASESTCVVKPLFVETWRGPSGERLSEVAENVEDTYVENVLVMFPRAGNFRVAFPIAAGDTGLVLVTKYPLDRFRYEGGGQKDPGDLTTFGMSGSVFFPVNLTTDGDALDASAGDGDTDIYAGAGGASDYVALKKDVDDIRTMLNQLKTVLNLHTHEITGGSSAGTTSGPSSTVSASYTQTCSKNFKVESN